MVLLVFQLQIYRKKQHHILQKKTFYLQITKQMITFAIISNGQKCLFIHSGPCHHAEI